MGIPFGDATAHRVVELAVEAARKRLGDGLEAAFCIGSLAHDGFVGAVSDIDVAFVLADTAAVSAERMAEIAADVRESPGVSPELAQRLSLFWETWSNLADGGGEGRFPAIDRADLMDFGVLLHGTDERARCTRPSATELARASAAFILLKFANEEYAETLRRPEALVAQGRRAVTKAVLFPVRILYTLATGKVDGNDPAVAWYTAAHERARGLVAGAMDLRTGTTAPDTLIGPLRADLVALYARTAEELAAALPGPEDAALRDGLAAFRALLGPGVSAD